MQKKETAKIQTPTPIIKSNPPKKDTKGYSCIDTDLQKYSLASPNSHKKKNTSKMKNLRNEFPVKTTGEFTQSSQQGNRPLQSDRLGVQKRHGENTEGIKRG